MCLCVSSRQLICFSCIFTCNNLFWKMLSNSILRTYTGFVICLSFPIYIYAYCDEYHQRENHVFGRLSISINILFEKLWLYFNENGFAPNNNVLLAGIIFTSLCTKECSSNLFFWFLEQVIACSRFAETTEWIEQIASTTTGAQQRREWRW